MIDAGWRSAVAADAKGHIGPATDRYAMPRVEAPRSMTRFAFKTSSSFRGVFSHAGNCMTPRYGDHRHLPVGAHHRRARSPPRAAATTRVCSTWSWSTTRAATRRRAILAREAGWARVLLEPTNHGFGRGCNLGFAHVHSPYTLFLNPDAAIEPAALRTMLEFMQQRPGAGIVGPATLCGNRNHPELQPTGPYPTPWSMVREAAAVPAAPLERDHHRAGRGADAHRLGVRRGAHDPRALVRELGGFDPRFFLYWEEIDLCRRAEQAGYENWVLGTALAHHVVGASSGGGPRVGTAVAKHYYQSRYYYMAKHHGWLAATAAEVGEFVLLSSDRRSMRCAAAGSSACGPGCRPRF